MFKQLPKRNEIKFNESQVIGWFNSFWEGDSVDLGNGFVMYKLEGKMYYSRTSKSIKQQDSLDFYFGEYVENQPIKFTLNGFWGDKKEGNLISSEFLLIPCSNGSHKIYYINPKPRKFVRIFSTGDYMPVEFPTSKGSFYIQYFQGINTITFSDNCSVGNIYNLKINRSSIKLSEEVENAINKYNDSVSLTES